MSILPEDRVLSLQSHISPAFPGRTKAQTVSVDALIDGFIMVFDESKARREPCAREFAAICEDRPFLKRISPLLVLERLIVSCRSYR